MEEKGKLVGSNGIYDKLLSIGTSATCAVIVACILGNIALILLICSIYKKTCGAEKISEPSVPTDTGLSRFLSSRYMQLSTTQSINIDIESPPPYEQATKKQP